MAADFVHGASAALMSRPVAPAKAGVQGERRGLGSLGSRLRGNDEIRGRATGDGLGRAARMGGEEPVRDLQTPITVDDVMNSRMIADPFRLAQCCLVTDGGGALILVAAEHARDFPRPCPDSWWPRRSPRLQSPAIKNEGRVRLFSSVYRQYLTVHKAG